MITDLENAFFQQMLDSANFLPFEQFENCANFQKAKSWLLEVGSLTQRFEETLATVTVVPHVEEFISVKEPIQHILKSNSSTFWQRDITLYGNNRPWLIARTLVPKEALLDDYQHLVDLGTIPLGKFLFSHKTLQRTQFDIANISLDLKNIPLELALKLMPLKEDKGNAFIENISAQKIPRPKTISSTNLRLVKLWARRSILRINHSQLYLSELFLPASPIY